MPDATLIAIPLLILGFVLLIAGGDTLVTGASALARRFGMSELVVGLTVVAFGTSAPEMVVSVTASATGENAISIGNVVGSNICNIALILGICALIRPVFAAKATVWKEIPFLMAASVVFVLMASNWTRDDGGAAAILSRADGVGLLIGFGLFLAYIVLVVRAGSAAPPADSPSPAPLTGSVLRVAVGLVFLIAGGNLVVTSAVDLAAAIGMSERVIGLTVVAIGTSLPELAASGMAAYRKKADIALGNIVGSNIFNTLLILGASAAISPMPVPAGSSVDLAVMMVVTLLLLVFMFTGRGPHQLQRVEGAAFIVIYAAYIGWLVSGQ